jgi:hypothetical protein
VGDPKQRLFLGICSVGFASVAVARAII